MDIVEDLLKKAPVEYRFIHHKEHIRSASEGAAFFQIDPGQTAPMLIVEGSGRYYAIIFSGSRDQLDFAHIARLLGVATVRLVKRDKLPAITGFTAGDTPMVGLGLPVVFDRRLLHYPCVYGGSGLPDRTLVISPADLAALNDIVAYLEA